MALNTLKLTPLGLKGLRVERSVTVTLQSDSIKHYTNHTYIDAYTLAVIVNVASMYSMVRTRCSKPVGS